MPANPWCFLVEVLPAMTAGTHGGKGTVVAAQEPTKSGLAFKCSFYPDHRTTISQLRECDCRV